MGLSWRNAGPFSSTREASLKLATSRATRHSTSPVNGVASNSHHALGRKYLGGRACPLLTFGVSGGLVAAKNFYDALKLFKRLVNMGDAKSLACHPASTTHRQMSVDEQNKAGVRPEMIRLSVGIEHIDDIIADLDQALTAACACCGFQFRKSRAPTPRGRSSPPATATFPSCGTPMLMV